MSWPAAAGLGVLVIGAGLRIWNIGLDSLWLDEIISLMLATGHAPTLQPSVSTASGFASAYLDWQPVSPADLIAAVRQDIHPPLYFFLLNLWTGAFGTTEVALRSLSALSSWLLLWPVYLIARELGGRRAALAAMFVAALSPAQLYFAQETRMYSLAMLFAALSSLCVWNVLRGERPIAWASAYSASAAAGLCTHYVFVFILVFQGLYAAVAAWRAPRRSHWVLSVPVALAVATVLLWPPLHSHLLRFVGGAQEAVAGGAFAAGPGDLLRWVYLAARAPLRLVAGENAWAKALYVAVVVLLLTPYVASRWRRGADWTVDGFLWLWLAIPLGCQVLVDLALGSSLAVSMRFTMLMAPPMCVLLGLGLAELAGSRRGRALAGLAIVVMIGVGAGTVAARSPFRYPVKSDAREAAAWLSAQLQNGDLLVVTGSVGSPQLLSYYLRAVRPQQPMLHWTAAYRGEPNALPDVNALRRYSRVLLFHLRSRRGEGEQIAAHLDTHLGAGRQVQPRLRLYERRGTAGGGATETP